MQSPLHALRTVRARRTQQPDGLHVYPKIVLQGRWLAERGFQPGHPVLVRYQANALCITNETPVLSSPYVNYFDTKIPRYFWLSEPQPDDHFKIPDMPYPDPAITSHKLVRTSRRQTGFSDPEPALQITGPDLAKAGFTPGAKIAITATMNTVTIHNMRPTTPPVYIDAAQQVNTPAAARILTVSAQYLQRKGVNRRYPLLRVGGRWLRQFGYAPGDPVTITYDHHTVTITKTPNTRRPHIPSGPHPFFRLASQHLADAGFAPGNKVAVTCTPDTITLTKIKHRSPVTRRHKTLIRQKHHSFHRQIHIHASQEINIHP